MTARRFFALVWRVDGIILFVVGVLGCLALVFAVVTAYRDAARSSHPDDTLNLANGQVYQSRAVLGTFERVRGTSVFRAPLHADLLYDLGFGSRDKLSSAQNYLLYDSASQRGRWLVSGTKVLFLYAFDLPERDADSGVTKSTPVVVTVYQLVEKDTDGDQKLTPDDDNVLAVSDPTGTTFTRLIDGVRMLKGLELVDEKTIMAFYSTKDRVKVAKIDVDTHRVLSDEPLPAASTGITK